MLISELQVGDILRSELEEETWLIISDDNNSFIYFILESMEKGGFYKSSMEIRSWSVIRDGEIILEEKTNENS